MRGAGVNGLCWQHSDWSKRHFGFYDEPRPTHWGFSLDGSLLSVPGDQRRGVRIPWKIDTPPRSAHDTITGSKYPEPNGPGPGGSAPPSRPSRSEKIREIFEDVNTIQLYEIDFEGVEYFEDEETGKIYNVHHQEVGKWNSDGDDIIWRSDEFKLAHERETL